MLLENVDREIPELERHWRAARTETIMKDIHREFLFHFPFLKMQNKILPN